LNKFNSSQKGSFILFALSLFIYFNLGLLAVMTAASLYRQYVFLKYQDLQNHARCLSGLFIAPLYGSQLIENTAPISLLIDGNFVFLSKKQGDVISYTENGKSKYYLMGTYEKDVLVHVFQ